MITIFAVPKAFAGHIRVIQRNALRSWRRLSPRVEIVLLGNDDGVREAAREFGAKHVPVACNAYGTPRLDSIIAAGEAAASHETLAFVNCDIVLLNDFPAALAGMPARQCLVVGNRTNIKVESELDIDHPEWPGRFQQLVAREGRVQRPAGMDYFAFRRGLWPQIPPFAIGRYCWDNWLIYEAHRQGATIIDATGAVLAAHQDHDYSHRGNEAELRQGPEAIANLALGRAARWHTHRDAHFKLRCKHTASGSRVELTNNWLRWPSAALRWYRRSKTPSEAADQGAQRSSPAKRAAA
jgi:hypothetical protein